MTPNPIIDGLIAVLASVGAVSILIVCVSFVCWLVEQIVPFSNYRAEYDGVRGSLEMTQKQVKILQQETERLRQRNDEISEKIVIWDESAELRKLKTNYSTLQFACEVAALLLGAHLGNEEGYISMFGKPLTDELRNALSAAGYEIPYGVQIPKYADGSIDWCRLAEQRREGAK